MCFLGSVFLQNLQVVHNLFFFVFHTDIGIDHDRLDLRPSGVCVDKEADTDGEDEGEDQAERHKGNEHKEVNEYDGKATECGYDVSACTEDREDQGVFEELGN